MFESLNIASTYVAGISGGGYLALKASSYAPEVVKKTFAIASAGFVELNRFPPLSFLLAVLPIALGFKSGGQHFARQMRHPITRAKQLLPNGTIELLPNAGHMITVDNQAIVMERLLKFFDLK